MSTLPAAVVLGLELNGLGVVRSLAKGPWRFPIIGFDADPSRASAKSRHVVRRKVASLDTPALIDALVAFGRSQPTPPVLFLTQEKTVELISQARDQLAPWFRFALPEPKALAQLTDKTGFQAMAEADGFPVPRSVRIAVPADIEATRGLAFPCVLKPTRRIAAYERRFRKAYKLADFAALAPLAEEVLPVAGELVVQEWIEGGDGDIFFCLQFRSAANRPLASFTGRKIRAWPPQVGGTASCVAAPEADAVLGPLTDRFFAATGGVGLLSMEYKRDVRDGRFLMVEPTAGRTDHQEEVATLNGVNIPLTAYAHLAGLDLPQAVAGPTAIWRDPVADVQSARAQGDGTLPSGHVYDAYFRLADPGPALARFAAALGRRLGISSKAR